MAEKLIRYYQYVNQEKGLEGKMQLAMETKIPSVRAAMEPDSPENLRVFKEAIRKITGKEAPSY